MARVLLAWELGGGFGHLAPLAAIAQTLRAAGHECAFALRDLASARKLPALREGRTFQAPLFLPGWRDARIEQHNHADLLASIGWRDAHALEGVLAGWIELLDVIDPDLVIYDHAPAAMAAARARGLPGIAVAASGFTLPPAVSPLPAFRHGNSGAESREGEVLRALNLALGNLGVPPVETLGALFDVEARALFSLPELDPYGPREDVEYLGPLHTAGGREPGWPQGDGPRVFAYLKRFDTLPALLDALAASGACALVHVSGLDDTDCARLSRGRLCVTTELFDIDRVLRDCALVISHGGSLAASALLAGRPQLLLPLYVEQQLTAERVQALGAGLGAPKLAPGGMREKLHRLLRDPAFVKNARTVATCHGHFPVSLDDALKLLTERLAALES